MTGNEATAIRNEIANFAQGLDLLLDAIAANTAIVSSIHEELCKDPPPSQTAAALAELTAAVREMSAKIDRK
jgi:hypothetical protein